MDPRPASLEKGLYSSVKRQWRIRHKGRFVVVGFTHRMSVNSCLRMPFSDGSGTLEPFPQGIRHPGVKAIGRRQKRAPGEILAMLDQRL